MAKKPRPNSTRRAAFAVADQFMPATAVKRLIQGRGGKKELKTIFDYAKLGTVAPLAFGASKDAARAGRQLRRGDTKRGLKNLGFAAAAVAPLPAGKVAGTAAKTARAVSKASKAAKTGGRKIKGKKPKRGPQAPAGYPTKSAGMDASRGRPNPPEPKPRKIKTDAQMTKSADRFAKRRTQIEQGKATDIKPTTQRGTIAQGTRRYRTGLDNQGRFVADKAIDRMFKTTYAPRESAKDRIARETGELGPRPSKKALSEARKEFRSTREFTDFRKRVKGSARGGSQVRDTFIEALARRKQARMNQQARAIATGARKGAEAAKSKAKKSTPAKNVKAVSEEVKGTISAARTARRNAGRATKPTAEQLKAFQDSTAGLRKMAESVAKSQKKSAGKSRGKTPPPSKSKGKGSKSDKSKALVPLNRARTLREATGRRRVNPATGKELVPFKGPTRTGKELVKSRRGIGYVPFKSVTEPAKRASAGRTPEQKRLLRKVGATAIGSTALAAMAQRQMNKNKQSQAAAPTTTKTGGSRPAPRPALKQPKAGGRRGYTVQGGDSFASIAKKHGVSVEELLAANKGRLTKNSTLYRGTLVRLPKSAKDPQATGVAGKKRGEGKPSRRAIRFRRSGIESTGIAGKPRGRGKLRGN